ncbi:MAG: DUF401 family protein [Spirochaetes bacterium]|nr:DUF401 family protein [Spirochaetota bacterium]MBU1080404.1 DUF401 family protein [Spirochaetota bacterium]
MPTVPALAQVLIVFALVVLAAARKVHLGLSAAVGGVVLALWRGLGPLEVVRVALAEALSPDTLLLVALMACIMAFSGAMKKSGAMESFSKTLAAVSPSPRFAMAAAPLLIGTLPMPGGAILSAPLVDAMDPSRERSAASLSAANYWFRHGLELAWPLYPAFILTASITGLDAGRLIALNLYAVPVLFCLGLVFILPAPGRALAKAVAPGAAPGEAHGEAHGAAPATEPLRTRFAAFAAGIAPLALVLGTYMALGALWGAISPALGLGPSLEALVARFAPIFLGLLAGSVYLLSGPTGRGAFKGSVGPATLRLIAVIVGIRVFSVLLSTAGVAAAAASELAAAGIPSIAAVAALPFVAGLVTGIGFGYVGLAFPIVLGLAPVGGPLPRESAIVLAGAFGYAGMMLSPLHVCMVVSAEHFNVGLVSIIRRFAAPLAAFLATAIAYASVLALWLP